MLTIEGSCLLGFLAFISLSHSVKVIAVVIAEVSVMLLLREE